MMSRWRLKCEECSNEWALEVSFDLSELGKIYLYCKKCKRNTFHKIIEYIHE